MMKTAPRALLVAGLAGAFLLFLARSFPALVGGIDFPDFYCAGVMTRQRIALYDPPAQQHCQMREAGRHGTYYIHPPFEALLFAPLAWLPLLPAYLVWNLVGCVLLALAMRTIVKILGWKWDWALLFALSFLFPPLLLNFVQGQDSVLLFVLVVLSFAAWERERYFEAGLLLGFGLFKFHLVLPCALLLLIRGRWRFAAGFASAALFLAAVSGACYGLDVFKQYAHFLSLLPQLPISGVHWQAMGNVRGLAGFLASPGSRAGAALVVLISFFLLMVGAWAWRRAGTSHEQRRLAYGASVIIALLVGYHLSPHDLTLLLLPMAILLDKAQHQSGTGHWLPIGLVAFLFLPPIHLLLLSSKYYALMGIFAVILLVVTVREIVRVRPERVVSARAVQ